MRALVRLLWLLALRGALAANDDKDGTSPFPSLWIAIGAKIARRLGLPAPFVCHPDRRPSGSVSLLGVGSPCG